MKVSWVSLGTLAFLASACGTGEAPAETTIENERAEPWGESGTPSSSDPTLPLPRPELPASPGDFSWPDGQVAAVSLTYDDGLDGQLKNAVPALDARDLKGTFFLSSFQGVDHLWSLPNLVAPLTVRHEAWKAVGESGHELAAHTIFHPCETNNPGYQPADYDTERMAAELDEANQRIERLSLSSAVHSFAYPCEGDASGLAGGTSYTGLVVERYSAARASAVGVSDPRIVDLHAVSQKFGDSEGMRSAELISYVDEAISRGAWAVFTFHGIGSAAECDINQFELDSCALNYLTTENSEHEALLDYLVEKGNEVWTAPMAEVGQYIAQGRL